jgi:hypothetical protein
LWAEIKHSCDVWERFNLIATGKIQDKRKKIKEGKREKGAVRREMTICALLFYSEAVPMLNRNLFKMEEHSCVMGILYS